MLDDRGHMTPTEVERTLDVDVAVQWNTGYDTITRSFVNVIATPHHGTHVTGFDRALARTVNEQLRAARLLKNGDEPVTKDDILEGLTAVVTVRLPEPQFEGQTKEVLGTPAATAIVQQVVSTPAQGLLREPAARRQAAGPRRPRQDRRRGQDPDRRPRAPGEPAPQVGARQLEPARQAGRLPLRRRPQRAVHRRGRLRARHRQARPRLRVPGPAADPRQDPQRAEVVAWPTCSRTPSAPRSSRSSGRLGQHVRPRLGPLPAGDPDGRRRRGRRAHPHPAAHPVPPVHAAHAGRGPGVRRRARRCTGSS